MTQEVADNSVLIERRQQLHERTGVALETLYTSSIEEHLPELAHHYGRSANAPKALEYQELCGRLAEERSAYVEAVIHFSAALGLLRTMPHSPRRAEQELMLLLALGTPIAVTKSWNSPDMELVYGRARELCQEVGETPQLFPALFGLAANYYMRGEYGPAREIIEQNLRLAQRSGDTNMLLQTYHELGNLQTYTGELAAARQSLDEVIRRYDSKTHSSPGLPVRRRRPGGLLPQPQGIDALALGLPRARVADCAGGFAARAAVVSPNQPRSRVFLDRIGSQRSRRARERDRTGRSSDGSVRGARVFAFCTGG